MVLVLALVLVLVLVLVIGVGGMMVVVMVGLVVGEREKTVGVRRSSRGLLQSVFVRILEHSSIHSVSDGPVGARPPWARRKCGLLPKVQIPTCSERTRRGRADRVLWEDLCATTVGRGRTER